MTVPDSQSQIFTALKKFTMQNFRFTVYGDLESMTLALPLNVMLN
ncbi:MAG: hypothetical protein OXI87_25110 [Albidovulum sp.]|nr:hypothetical protein [Albidovulum sp.]